MTGLWKKSDIRKNTKPISGTHASSNFSKAARTKSSNQRRGSGDPGRRPHQYQAGPNLDIHTIKIRASDQKHSAQFIARNAQGMARPLLLDIQGYTMPFNALPSCAIPAFRPHPQSKKRFTSLVRRRSLVVPMGTGYAPPRTDA